MTSLVRAPLPTTLIPSTFLYSYCAWPGYYQSSYRSQQTEALLNKNRRIGKENLKKFSSFKRNDSDTMCWRVFPTPTRYVKCAHTVNVPRTEEVIPCGKEDCPGIENSSQGKRTDRINKCPDCVARERQGVPTIMKSGRFVNSPLKTRTKTRTI